MEDKVRASTSGVNARRRRAPILRGLCPEACTIRDLTHGTIIGTVYSTYYEETMLVIDAPGAAVVTTSEVKKDLPGTFRLAKERRVYVTADGQPIGGIVGMETMQLLEEFLPDLELFAHATSRLAAIRRGDDVLLDEDDFRARAEAQFAASARDR
jgi:hypothetical protein